MGLKENIADYRKKMGLTQEQLAEKCNVSRQAVTNGKVEKVSHQLLK